MLTNEIQEKKRFKLLIKTKRREIDISSDPWNFLQSLRHLKEKEWNEFYLLLKLLDSMLPSNKQKKSNEKFTAVTSAQNKFVYIQAKSEMFSWNQMFRSDNVSWSVYLMGKIRSRKKVWLELRNKRSDSLKHQFIPGYFDKFSFLDSFFVIKYIDRETWFDQNIWFDEKNSDLAWTQKTAVLVQCQYLISIVYRDFTDQVSMLKPIGDINLIIHEKKMFSYSQKKCHEGTRDGNQSPEKESKQNKLEYFIQISYKSES